ncbi:hypothetical protein F4811DRAFT_58 [Daldinia bambusicola]|nr:hypothetical protein F4811DRAFT_58 [Daldinia bambusicola]
MFPPERSHQKCIVERISRSNQLVDSRYLHIVWVSSVDKHGKHVGFKIILSPISKNVDITDVLFLQAISAAWDMMWYWLGEMLTKNEDVNFATYNENYIKQVLSERWDPKSIKERNEQSKEYNELYKKQIRSIISRKKAEREQIQAQEKEAAEEIIKVLRQASNFEDRQERLKRWIANSETFKLVSLPREFAKKVWVEKSEMFTDDPREITAWFWSMLNDAAEEPASNCIWPQGPSESKGKENESLDDLLDRTMWPMKKRWADEVADHELSSW